MGTYETLTLFGGILSMVVAIAAAASARTSADAAEKQAGHAEQQAKHAGTQADAAAVQARAAERQVSQMTYQSGIAAREVLIAKIDTYASEIALLEQASANAGAIASHMDHLAVGDARNQAQLQVYGQITASADELRSCSANFAKFTDSEPGFADRTALRRAALRVIQALGQDSGTFALRLEMNVYADNYSTEAIEQERTAIARAAPRADTVSLSLRRNLETAITELWTRVHVLEQQILAGTEV